MRILSAMVELAHWENRAWMIEFRSRASGWMERTFITALRVDVPMPIFSRSISARMGYRASADPWRASQLANIKAS